MCMLDGAGVKDAETLNTNHPLERRQQSGLVGRAAGEGALP